MSKGSKRRPTDEKAVAENWQHTFAPKLFKCTACQAEFPEHHMHVCPLRVVK